MHYSKITQTFIFLILLFISILFPPYSFPNVMGIIKEINTSDFGVLTRNTKENQTNNINKFFVKVDRELSLKNRTKKVEPDKKNEELYLFTLDFIRSLMYIKDSNVGGFLSIKDDITGEKLGYTLAGKKADLLEAQNKMLPWRKSQNIKIRTMSEDLFVGIRNYNEISDLIWETFKNYLTAEMEKTKEVYKIALAANFPRGEDGKIGTPKEIDELQKQVDGLYSLIIEGRIYREKNTLNLGNVDKFRFKFSKKQLLDIYTYISEYNSKRSQTEKSDSNQLLSFPFFIIEKLICHYLKGDYFGFPENQCTIDNIKP